MATIRVGISGWAYPGWRGDFYPTGLLQRNELAYAGNRFTSIEINGSFYSLQRPTSYAAWRDQTPDDLVFAVKGGRYITHMKRLVDVDIPLANFFASGVLALGPKLGPILWQLSPAFVFDADKLAGFFDVLPRTTAEAATLARRHDDKLAADRALTSTDQDRPIRHALEVRHESFEEAAALDLLRRHDIGLVVADTAGRWPLLHDVTSDFVYVRLHGAEKLYASGYTPAQLDHWAWLCREWAEQGCDVYVYFDNDAEGHAPYDAMGLLERVQKAAARAAITA
jgi:uncharacterized protein YecE (DUF72 family)